MKATGTMTTTHPRFALRSGESWRDPFSAYAELRDHDPAHHETAGDYWVITRFEDVWNAARDTSTFSSASGLTVAYGEIEALGMGENIPMVFLDPPDHTRFRRLVSADFTPRRVTQLEDGIREFVKAGLTKLSATDTIDIVDALFKPLPSFVVAHYLGVPAHDRAKFDVWTDAIVSAAAGEPTGESATDAFNELIGYFLDLIERRRADPGDDLVSKLVAMGEDTVGITRVLGFAFTMVAGGNDTAAGLLAGTAGLLTDNVGQRARLIDDPGLIGPALEEFLRLTSPVQNLARTVTRDVTLHGVAVPAGRKVLLCYGAANRDPREFGPTAEDLDVGRQIDKILTFSYGAHHCLGAAVARLQGRVVVEQLLATFPGFEADTAGGEYASGSYVRRFRSLPFTPGRRQSPA